MRHSKQRNKIYDIVKNTDVHPTADWVYDKARGIMPSISLGTVYRNLGQLVERGMLNSLSFKGTIRYDGMLENHHHFACISCGKIYDIFINTGELLEKINSRSDHSITELKVEFSGTCNNCKN